MVAASTETPRELAAGEALGVRIHSSFEDILVHSGRLNASSRSKTKRV